MKYCSCSTLTALYGFTKICTNIYQYILTDIIMGDNIESKEKIYISLKDVYMEKLLLSMLIQSIYT